ncbi:hypothetical protein ACHHV8_30015 [Paenibacillus sp. TAB 01]|uniref:hypothetical protein n=1 Tax=Paenibacillus sp. TAB 01 TaxID=3368988 RepID=UPI0037525884
MYRGKLEKYRRMIEELGSETETAVTEGHIEHPCFGSYILLKRAVANAQSDLDWCRWVLELIHLNHIGSVEK